MADNTYNGWTNLDTWSVNLHFGDYWGADTGLRDEPISAEEMQSDVEAFIDEALEAMPEGQRLFIGDWMNLSAVNWNELASFYESDEVCRNGKPWSECNCC